MITKAELRKSVRARLQHFTREEMSAKSRAICDTLRALPAWKEARVVCLFAPHMFEPDVELLWPHIGKRRACYPRVNERNLDLLLVSDRDELVSSRWSLREPPHSEQNLARVEDVDLLLVPGLAFTRGKGRLGRGGGYYDRLIARPGLRAHKLGVCFETQIVPELPTEAHDREVDQIVTESGVA
jgi:5-formyltetrahydrofolate cyclo-ligase